MLTFIVNLDVDIINQLMNNGLEAEYIAQIVKKFSLNFTSAEDLLDVCLLSLTILSYALLKRPDLAPSIDQVMLNYLDRFLG